MNKLCDSYVNKRNVFALCENKVKLLADPAMERDVGCPLLLQLMLNEYLNDKRTIAVAP